MTSVPQTHPPLRGAKRWRDWCYEPPYMSHNLVEAWRREWQESVVLDVRKLEPWMNVTNLYWCPLSEPHLEPEVLSALNGPR